LVYEAMLLFRERPALRLAAWLNFAASHCPAGRQRGASISHLGMPRRVRKGIAAKAHARHHLIEAPHVCQSAAQTVKATAAFPSVNGFPQRPAFPEVRGFGRRHGLIPRSPLSRKNGRAILARAHRPDLLWRPDIHIVTRLAAFQHAQYPQLIEPPHCIARRPRRKTQRSGHCRHRKP